jgi:hypothetical protein
VGWSERALWFGWKIAKLNQTENSRYPNTLLLPGQLEMIVEIVDSFTRLVLTFRFAFQLLSTCLHPQHLPHPFRPLLFH